MDVIKQLKLSSVTVSSSLYGAPKLTEDGVFEDWTTRNPTISEDVGFGAKEAVVMLKLPFICLLSTVILENRGTSQVTVQVSTKKKASSFLTVFDNMRLPHDRSTSLDIGHVPCKFVRLICHRGNPIGIERLSCHGITLTDLRMHCSPALAPLLFDKPLGILFDGAVTDEAVQSNKFGGYGKKYSESESDEEDCS